MTSSLTSPKRADVRDELGQRTRAHKRSESLDQKLGFSRPQQRQAPGVFFTREVSIDTKELHIIFRSTTTFVRECLTMLIL